MYKLWAGIYHYIFILFLIRGHWFPVVMPVT